MKLFVWDLHGVLEQGNEDAVVAVTNAVLENQGYGARLTADDCRMLYGRKWYEYFEHLLPAESRETHLALQKASFSYSDDNFKMVASHLRPTTNSHEVLARIREAGHTQLLISNTQPTGLYSYMEALGLHRFFPAGYWFACSTHHPDAADSKEKVLQDFVDGRRFDEIIIIGDSPTDIALSRVCPGTTYLYSHPGIPFRECEADYRINDLREVLKHV